LKVAFRFSRPFFYAVILTLAISYCASMSGQNSFNSARAESYVSIVNPETYVVRPGDRFRIDFWDGSTKAMDIIVTPEGSLLLPSIGALKVGNLTLTEAKAKLENLINRFYSETDFTVSLVGVRPVKVLVMGGIKNPGLYDGNAFSRVSEMIGKAGGFVDGASRRRIRLFGYGEDHLIDILRFERSGDLDANPSVYSGDKILVPLVNDSSSFIHISGEVILPGSFEFVEGDRLGSVIELAMGLTGLESDSVYIYRKSGDYLKPIVKSITELTFPIKEGDKIIIGRRPDVYSTDYFSIVGEIKEPGRYPYQTGLNLKQAILNAGGLAPKADIFSLAIFRKFEFMRPGENIEQLKAFSPNNLSLGGNNEPVSLKIDGSFPEHLDAISVEPGDSIIIPPKTGLVGIYGMVNRPGTIGIEGYEKASDLIKKAGGFSREAYKKAVVVIRKSSGMKIIAAPNIDIFDGDTVIIEEEKGRRNLWEKLRDFSLILGGASLVYLAVDNMTD